MAMLRKLGRLFTIKTRFEAWLVIYAIALGAVERGRLYLETYPGYGGWMLALACTGVVFIAGASCSIPCVRRNRRWPPGPIRPAQRVTWLLVVVDPGASRSVALQNHGLRAAQIDPGPGDRAGTGPSP